MIKSMLPTAVQLYYFTSPSMAMSCIAAACDGVPKSVRVTANRISFMTSLLGYTLVVV